ncbi:MAG: magnesium transporter MgtE N-terminal domain-containing protein [Acidimicrobiales bacterium]
MSAPPIFVSRLVRLPLLDADGVAVGRVVDVVLSASGPTESPGVLGFVAAMQRRRIFVNVNRVGEIDAAGARLRSGTVDLRRFGKRQGELLAKADVFDRRVGAEVVNDLALVAGTGGRAWEVASVSLSTAGLLRRRRAGRVVPWTELRSLFDAGPVARQVAALRELHPVEMAAAIARLPSARRAALAEAMDDRRLADLLEELPEDEQVELIESLNVERAADVLEEMDPDDAADLLVELPAAERAELLAAMEPDEATPLRRLLAYQGNTAGGLMTPEPLIVSGEATVAEALARMRDPDLPAAIAAHVFVVEAPLATPTGRYLGPVGFQRLLREPPGSPVARCVDSGPEPVGPDVPEAEVARRLAAYDVVAIPVVDDLGRLVGVVTVDDVLDHVLPQGWRRRR